jgi:hypothetical protein
VTVPLAILDAIRQQPDHEPHWLALAAHLSDNGECDLATVVRHHWPVLRDNLAAGVTIEETLRRIGPRMLRRIATQARQAESGDSGTLTGSE